MTSSGEPRPVSCPRCDAPMTEVRDPDIVYRRCDACGAVFLDPGDLNILATGMAGDIEFCSIDRLDHEDARPDAQCPRCDGAPMSKINLLGYSDIIFDWCKTCGGFLLDGDEIEAMNRHLAEIAGTLDGEEARTRIDGRLVRLDCVDRVAEGPSAVEGLLPESALGVRYFRLSVWFDEPLDAGLRITPETGLHRLAALVGLGGEDIETGDDAFDERFVVRADDADGARRILGPAIRERMVAFAEKGPTVLDRRGRFEVLDNRLVYTEGPYDDAITVALHRECEDVTAALLDMAALLEGKDAS